MTVQCGGGAATWLLGTQVALTVQGHGLPPLHARLASFSEPLVDDQKAFSASFSP